VRTYSLMPRALGTGACTRNLAAGKQRVTRSLPHLGARHDVDHQCCRDGFVAETHVGEGLPTSSQVALIALIGPTSNPVLAGLGELLRVTFASQGPADAFLFMHAHALQALKAEVSRERQDQDDQDQET
jgi:hypothetical protein